MDQIQTHKKKVHIHGKNLNLDIGNVANDLDVHSHF